jgi:hypothetical protein
MCFNLVVKINILFFLSEAERLCWDKRKIKKIQLLLGMYIGHSPKLMQQNRKNNYLSLSALKRAA